MTSNAAAGGPGGGGGAVSPALTPWWAFLVAGLVHSFLMYAAFPPVGIWPLSLLAPAPLIWAGTRAGTRPFRAGLLAGAGVVPLWVVEFRWLLDVAGVWYVLMAVYAAAYHAVFVWMLGAWRRAPGRAGLIPVVLVAAVLWTGLEVIRGEVVMGGLPWFLVSHPQVEWMGSYAAGALGQYFLVFTTVGVFGVAGLVLGPRRTRLETEACGRGHIWTVLAIAGLWGVAAVAGSRGPGGVSGHARVAVVQTNLPQDNKEAWRIEDRLRDFEEFLRLTREAAKGRPDLIAWPETMFPGMTLDEASFDAERRAELRYRVRTAEGAEERVPSTTFRDRLVELQGELGIPLLVGGIAHENLRIGVGPDGGIEFAHDARYNSAFMIRGGRVEEARYDKLELMAFGETVPYVSDWPWAKQMVARLSGVDWVFDLHYGRREQVFTLDVPARDGYAAQRVGFVTPICFEGTMPRVTRRLARASSPDGQRAAFILNISNDGWFGPHAGGREQHLLAMRWRTVETGLPVVRAVNTGISAAVDHRGSVMTPPGGGAGELRLEPRVAGVLTADVPLRGPGGTVYLVVGNVFGSGCSMLTVLCGGWLVVSGWQRERAGRGGKANA